MQSGNYNFHDVQTVDSWINNDSEQPSVQQTQSHPININSVNYGQGYYPHTNNNNNSSNNNIYANSNNFFSSYYFTNANCFASSNNKQNATNSNDKFNAIKKGTKIKLERNNKLEKDVVSHIQVGVNKKIKMSSFLTRKYEYRDTKEAVPKNEFNYIKFEDNYRKTTLHGREIVWLTGREVYIHRITDVITIENGKEITWDAFSRRHMIFEDTGVALDLQEKDLVEINKNGMQYSLNGRNVLWLALTGGWPKKSSRTVEMEAPQPKKIKSNLIENSMFNVENFFNSTNDSFVLQDETNPQIVPAGFETDFSYTEVNSEKADGFTL